MSIDDFGALFLVDIINALGVRRDDPLTASDAKDINGNRSCILTSIVFGEEQEELKVGARNFNVEPKIGDMKIGGKGWKHPANNQMIIS